MGHEQPVHILSNDEKGNLLKQPNSRYPTGKRNYLILKVMLTSGIKLSELTALKWDDFDQENYELKIRSKNKFRIVKINEELIQLMHLWKKFQQENIASNVVYIFTTLKGEPLKNRYIQQMLARYARRGNIKKRVSPKVLRYTYAVELYKENRDLTLLQSQLGLSSQLAIWVHNQLMDTTSNPGTEKLDVGDFQNKESITKKSNTSERKEHHGLSMHAIKCMCGEIVIKNMEHCPGCRMEVEDLLKQLKNNFYKVNWGLKE